MNSITLDYKYKDKYPFIVWNGNNIKDIKHFINESSDMEITYPMIKIEDDQTLIIETDYTIIIPINNFVVKTEKGLDIYSLDQIISDYDLIEHIDIIF